MQPLTISLSLPFSHTLPLSHAHKVLSPLIPSHFHFLFFIHNLFVGGGNYGGGGGGYQGGGGGEQEKFETCSHKEQYLTLLQWILYLLR